MATAAKPAKKKQLDKALVLVSLLRAKDEVLADKKAMMADFAERLENLENTIRKIARDIETGQGGLFDFEEVEPLAGVKEALANLQDLADKDGTTMTLSHEGKEILKVEPKK